MSVEMHDQTPSTMVVTGTREEFFGLLEPGDVLLFQGADFLAGLAQLTERRPCYHSAVYLGRSGDGAQGVHRFAHNVSTLWWRDLAKRNPGAPDGRVERPKGADIVTDLVARKRYHADLAVNLATHHLLEPADRTSRTDLALDLVNRGGVGVVSLAAYLDRHQPERLYGKPSLMSPPVHHVRSAVALRHRTLWPKSTDAARRPLLDAAAAQAEEATGFNAAELLSVVPRCLDRPGYLEWQAIPWRNEAFKGALVDLLFATATQTQRDALNQTSPDEIVRHRLRTVHPEYHYPDVHSGPGWICASYVAAVYEAAGLDLKLGTVEGVELVPKDKTPVPMSTPRDLWDTAELVPIALLARGPERWAADPGGEPMGPTDPAPTSEGEPASADGSGSVFVDFTGEAVGTTLRIGPDLTIPVVAGPTTAEEAEQLALEELAWLWSSAPGSPTEGSAPHDPDDPDEPSGAGDNPVNQAINLGVALFNQGIELLRRLAERGDDGDDGPADPTGPRAGA